MAYPDQYSTSVSPSKQPPDTPISASDTQVLPELTPAEEAGIYRLQHQLNIWISKIEHRQQLNMVDWKPRLNDTVRGAYRCVVDHMRSVPSNRRKAIATKLYWLNNDTSVWFALSESLGVPFSALEQHLYLYPTRDYCQCCCKTTTILRHSRDEVLDDLMCAQCAEGLE